MEIASFELILSNRVVSPVLLIQKSQVQVEQQNRSQVSNWVLGIRWSHEKLKYKFILNSWWPSKLSRLLVWNKVSVFEFWATKIPFNSYIRRGPPVDTFYIFPRIFRVFDSSFAGEEYKKNRGVLAWTISGRAEFQNSWFEGEFLKILFNRSKMTLNVFF